MTTRRGRKRATVTEFRAARVIPTATALINETENTAITTSATTTTTTTTATTTAMVTTELPSMRLPIQSKTALPITEAPTTNHRQSTKSTENNTWEPIVDIKLENTDEDDVRREDCDNNDERQEQQNQAALAAIAAVDVIIDIKPDVDELKQEIMRQQQQQQQQQQQLHMITLPAEQQQLSSLQKQKTQKTTKKRKSSMQLQSSPLKRVVVINDLTRLALAAQLTESGGGQLNYANLLNGSDVSSGGLVGTSFGTSAVGAIPASSLLCIGGISGAVMGGGAGSTSVIGTNENFTKFLDDSFVKDEFDLQETDVDEEGCSDIDFDDNELVEDDEDIDLYDPKWTLKSKTTRMVFKFETPQSDIGLEGRPKSTDPMFYFEKILGNVSEFFNLLAEGSNERAQHKLRTNNVGQMYFKQISSEEMRIFFAICLQMSTMKLPTLTDYWLEEKCWGFEGFASKISLNRFQMMLRLLNFDKLQKLAYLSESSSNINQMKDDDCETENLGDLKPLLNFFNQRMSAIYKCGQRLVLNEPIMYWKGKLNWVRDLREKFRCNAITLHFLTENSGLVLKIMPDVERKEHKQHVRNSKLLVIHRIKLAMKLLKEHLGKGHTVLVSKYYGSYGLGFELAQHNTYCTGLLDHKRYGNCKELVLKQLHKHSFATMYASSIMTGKWRRCEKCVYFYSSDCLAIYAQETRYSDPRLKIIKELDWQLQLPSNIKDYMLNYQLGLDRFELKWDKQLAVYVFNLIMFNAYILYTKFAQFGRTRPTDLHLKDTQLKSYADFRREVITKLLCTQDNTTSGNVENSLTAEKPSSSIVGRTEDDDDDECDDENQKKLSHTSVVGRKKLLEVEHLPMVLPRRNDKIIKKKCRICRKGGMLTFTKLCCETCPGKPGLCETPCFKIFHDQLKRSLEAGVKIKTRTFGTSGEKTIYF